MYYTEKAQQIAQTLKINENNSIGYPQAVDRNAIFSNNGLIIDRFLKLD